MIPHVLSCQLLFSTIATISVPKVTGQTVYYVTLTSLRGAYTYVLLVSNITNNLEGNVISQSFDLRKYYAVVWGE